MKRSGWSVCARALAAALFVLASAAPALAEKRVALVVGNAAYRHIPRLDNPANDARLMAETLRALGFTLAGGAPQLDLDEAGFRRAVQDFGKQIAGADVALFYYAGHGLQVRGNNYLAPVGANPVREADVDFHMLDANVVLRQMDSAGARLNIVILDACRNNPFSRDGAALGWHWACADAGAARHADLVCDAARQRRARWHRQQSLHQGARRCRTQARPRHLPHVQRRRSCRRGRDRRRAAAVDVAVANPGRLLLRRPSARQPAKPSEPTRICTRQMHRCRRSVPGKGSYLFMREQYARFTGACAQFRLSASDRRQLAGFSRDLGSRHRCRDAVGQRPRLYLSR